MSVCGGFRGGFSFNPGMLTSMNFRHSCGGGSGLGGEQRTGLAAGPSGGKPGGGSSRGTRRAGADGLGRLHALRPASRTAAARPRPGIGTPQFTPQDFALALCNARSEGRAVKGKALATNRKGLKKAQRPPRE